MKEIFSSHQPRHLLNTLAQRAMLSDIEIAFWSGRKNVEQNNVYDNRTWEELRQNERRVLFADEMISELGGGSKEEIICKIKDHLKTLEEKTIYTEANIIHRKRIMLKGKFKKLVKL